MVAHSVSAAELVLVEKGRSLAPLVISTDAPPASVAAAKNLAVYIEKISGARPELITGAPSPLPSHAIWVGIQPAMTNLFSGLDISFQKPEEILIACNGRHLLVAGRDRITGSNQTEFGTANAVYTFLQKDLGVRWLWPGELGEDFVRRDKISLSPSEYRFHPQFRTRLMYYPRERAKADVNTWWDVCQRCRGSAELPPSHSFQDWWELYHETHPDYFALLQNGKRALPEDGSEKSKKSVKLCVSNPRVAAQWLDNAEKTLKQNPHQATAGAFPNDGGGWCFCERCKAWDNPNGPKVMYGDLEYVMLTDRYVKFWNILARGLKERFPDREIFVGTGAYSKYRTPPVAEILEPNILVLYVGSFPVTCEAQRKKEKADWKAWADKATVLLYRPNLFGYSGGPWGLPSIALKNTIEDMPFLARNKGVGLVVDSALNNFATMGPQNYLIAQLAYDPLQDGRALLDDYYRRGFGPAAEVVRAYFELLEEAHDRFVEWNGFFTGGYRKKGIEVFQLIYTDEFLDRAEKKLLDARGMVARGPAIYQQRVTFVRNGLEFIRLQVRIMQAMKRVRATEGKDAGAVRTAVELCNEREKLFQRAAPFALDGPRINSQIQRCEMRDYLGPPSEAFTKAAARTVDPDEE
jgi:hypothetical protein